MAWITLVPVAEAKGLVRKHFDAAVERAGRVWNIVQIMSPNPRVMDTSMAFYAALMHGASPLTRMQRELLATVTSAELKCRY